MYRRQKLENKNNEDKKNEDVEESKNVSNSSKEPKSMTEFLERAKSYEHLIKQDRHLKDPKKLQKFKKKMVSKRLCHSTKNTFTLHEKH